MLTLIADRSTHMLPDHKPVHIVIFVWIHGYAIIRSADDIVALLIS